MAGNEQKNISNLINEEYKEWGVKKRIIQGEEIVSGDMILIDADMGTGKTYFVFKHLASYAKQKKRRILYLCNRTYLADDANAYQKKFNAKSVKIMTYQKLEKIIMQQNKTRDKNYEKTDEYKKQYEDICKYDYVVADEFHYFLEDSGMNPFTFYSYNFVMERNTQIKILISATPGYLENLLKNTKINYKYELKKDTSPIKLQFYRDNKGKGKDFVKDKIEKILSEDTDEKIIYFINDTKRFNELKNKSGIIKKNSYCLSAKNKDKDIIHNNDDLITFDKRLLMTTSVIANGVSLKDRRIKYIFCDIEEINTAVQCIGRKRLLDENDTCCVYVRYYLEDELKHKLKKANKQILIADKIYENPAEFANEYGDFSGLKSECLIIDWLDGVKVKINVAKYLKYTQDALLYSFIETENEEHNTENDPSYGYGKVFEIRSGIKPSGKCINYYITDEDFNNMSKQILERAYDLISNNLNKKIFVKTEVYKNIISVKSELNNFFRKNNKKALSKGDFFKKICSCYGLRYRNGICRNRGEYRDQSYVIFELEE